MVQFHLHSVIALLVAGASLTSGLAVQNATNVSPAPDVTSPLTLSASRWIWNSATTTANAQIGLRKDFTPPLGKALIAAEIIIAGNNRFQLYVNGDYLGAGDRPRFGHRFCVDLLPSFNVFAVNASTTVSGSGGVSGGLIATILLTYTDGTTDTLVTDSSWRVKQAPPAGWETLGFDDTTWAVATVVGSYGVSPWQTVVVALPADPPVVSFANVAWVWTDVVPASGTVPAGSRAFRSTFVPDPNQVPASATIIISADNAYTLYVNGVTIGSGSSWPTAQRYTVNFTSRPTELVLAVLATNTVASAAGVILSMEVNMVPSGRNNCTAGVFLMTDGSWKSTKDLIPAGFEQPGFDDSTWPAVVGEGAYGVAPWDTLTIATVATPVAV
ncbi:hypothetical protein B0H16DRAFT_726385 [Mycena metata]|uniref:Lectin n=1 Tax=Mycena metata TaxID=1033252 RepID=A0AAD7NY77_9AGAR|nr:hypothetical protein B0H16DRAFT_726385 [Mycena metata]